MARGVFTQLREDHRTLKELLDKLNATTHRGVKVRKELVRKLETELRHHTTLEEELLYPLFKENAPNQADAVAYHEARQEHQAADKVLKDLLRADVATNAFGGKAKVLSELVQHHVEEEERELFPRIKEVLTREQLVSVAEQMETRRQALKDGRAWNRASAAG